MPFICKFIVLPPQNSVPAVVVGPSNAVLMKSENPTNPLPMDDDDDLFSLNNFLSHPIAFFQYE
jgi:hypothetical protein